MYVIVQFDEANNKQGGGLGLVLRKWITPKKKEVFWPPVKEQYKFDKLLKQNEEPNPEKWEIHAINRCFYETEDFEKAKKKLKQAEITSDLQSEGEELQRPRVKNRPKRLYSSSDDENHFSAFDRPPKPNKISIITEKNCEELNSLSTPRKSISQIICLSTPRKSISQTVACTSSLQLSTNVSSLKKTAPASAPPKSSFDDIFHNSDIANHNTPLSSNLNFGHSSGFQKKILDTLITIREQNKEICEQNKEILSLMKKNQENVGLHIFTLPDLPVGLPLQTENDIQELEIFLSSNNNLTRLGTYLASIGGKTLATRTYGVLKQLLTDEVATCYNFYGAGKSNKKAFSKLTVNKLIIYAVKIGYSQATDTEVENCVKVWLKHARERLQKKRKLND